LTTKTVQETAMASENQEFSVGLSILLSILYVPLLYYHNIARELETREMLALEAFDTDTDLWIPWVQDARKALDLAEDERKVDRKHQLEMAYRCFEKSIPERVRGELREIYMIPADAESQS